MKVTLVTSTVNKKLWRYDGIYTNGPQCIANIDTAKVHHYSETGISPKDSENSIYIYFRMHSGCTRNSIAYTFRIHWLWPVMAKTNQNARPCCARRSATCLQVRLQIAGATAGTPPSLRPSFPWVWNWLVVCFYPSERYEFVNWDDYSQYMGKSKIVQTTNQISVEVALYISRLGWSSQVVLRAVDHKFFVDVPGHWYPPLCHQLHGAGWKMDHRNRWLSQRVSPSFSY